MTKIATPIEVEFQSFIPRIETALRALGMEQDMPRIPALLGYVKQLQRWNRVYNLTAVRDPSEMLVQHIFDSLSIVPVLRLRHARRSIHVADMGSGAGLPGIILAICQPDWTLTCVDAVSKKTAFIHQAAGVLGLSNVQALHGRIESLPSLQADIVVSRAFASLSDFVRLAAHHRSAGGVLLAMKGLYPDDECIELEEQTGWLVAEHTHLHVPELNAVRCLLELKEPHD